jgi:hypothetical protein
VVWVPLAVVPLGALAGSVWVLLAMRAEQRRRVLVRLE